MQIDRFEYQGDINGTNPPTVMGLNIQRQFGCTHVNLFSLKENTGPTISSNLPGIAKEIVNNVLVGETLESVTWTFISSFRKSMVQFHTINDQPYRMDLSDLHAAEFESHGPNWSWDIERYQDEYDGVSPSRRDEGKTQERTLPNHSKTVFTVPCGWAVNAPYFYCIPSFSDSEDMKGNYEFFLADTRKVIAQLQVDDPKILGHAAWKFSGADAQRHVKNNSLLQPYDMGLWNYNERRGLKFCSGHAGLLHLARDIDMPYFPMAVEKAMGMKNLKAVKNKVGYRQAGGDGPVQEFCPD